MNSIANIQTPKAMEINCLSITVQKKGCDFTYTCGSYFSDEHLGSGKQPAQATDSMIYSTKGEVDHPLCIERHPFHQLGPMLT